MATNVPPHVQQAVDTLVGHLATSEVVPAATGLNSKGQPVTDAMRACYQKCAQAKQTAIQGLMTSGNPTNFLIGLPSIVAAFNACRDACDE